MFRKIYLIIYLNFASYKKVNTNKYTHEQIDYNHSTEYVYFIYILLSQPTLPGLNICCQS
jgi:hypothetical protein